MINISIMRGSKGPFRLKRLSNGLYQIHSKQGGAYEGTRGMIFRMAVKMGVWPLEFRLAIKEMRKHGHNVAEFGIGGSFIFSSKEFMAA